MSNETPELKQLLSKLLSNTPGFQDLNTAELNFATKTGRPSTAAIVLPSRKTKAQALFQGQLNPKKLKAKRPTRLEQWVEIRVRDGVVTTTLYPDNAGVIKRGQKMWPPPDLVYRRLNFPDGIPPEYEWTGVMDEAHRRLGGCGIQRMTVDTWLEAIEEEGKRPDGHLNSVSTLPRPLECGECFCAVCQRKYAIMDRQRAA